MVSFGIKTSKLSIAYASIIILLVYHYILFVINVVFVFHLDDDGNKAVRDFIIKQIMGICMNTAHNYVHNCT